jgi:hypothetical protein
MSRCDQCGNRECLCDEPQSVYLSKHDVDRIAIAVCNELERRQEMRRVGEAKERADERWQLVSSLRSALRGGRP